MPKGLKSCPACGGVNGSKAHTCRQCGHSFVIARHKNRGRRQRQKKSNEPTGMLFRKVPITDGCKQTYDPKTTKLWVSICGQYLIRFATHLKSGVCVVPDSHTTPYAAIHKDSKGRLDLIRRSRTLRGADLLCKQHKDKNNA